MDAINRAAAAGQRAMDAQGKVGTILSKLPEDKNKIDRLANTVTKTAKSITDATSQGKTFTGQENYCVRVSMANRSEE